MQSIPSYQTHFWISAHSISDCGPIQWGPIQQNTFADGGTSYSAATNADACRAACVDNPSCVAIDMDTNAGNIFCWLHLSPDNLAAVGSRTGVQHQEIQDRCPSCRLFLFISYQPVHFTPSDHFIALSLWYPCSDNLSSW